MMNRDEHDEFDGFHGWSWRNWLFGVDETWVYSYRGPNLRQRLVPQLPRTRMLLGGFQLVMGVPPNGWFMENPMKIRIDN